MPSQRELFETYMQGVWENVLRDDAGADVYDNQHDATIIAQAFGARPTGRTTTENDAPWSEWLFADGSTIWIENDGGGTTHALQP